MNRANRDILVLTSQSHLSPYELELQVAYLNDLLYHAESWDNFCRANEIVDIHHHRIYSRPHLIEKALRDIIGIDKPFVFIHNKN
jgi:hypothetical protein